MEYLTENLGNDVRELLLFKLDDTIYAIDSCKISEILRLMKLEIPEKLPENAIGILEFNSYFINVIDLKGILDKKRSRYTLDNKIVIVNSDDNVFAFVTDEIIDIKRIKKSDIKPAPYFGEYRYSEAFVSLGDDNVVILNVDILSDRIKNSICKDDTENLINEVFPTDENSLVVLENRKNDLKEKVKFENLANYYLEEDYLTFQINQDFYCIDISKVKYFHKLKADDKIVKIPNTPKYALGLLNIKGEFITILDLSTYLNLGETKITNNSIIVVFETSDATMGILVDKIGARLDIHGEILTENVINDFQITSFVNDEIIYSIVVPEELFDIKRLSL